MFILFHLIGVLYVTAVLGDEENKTLPPGNHENVFSSIMPRWYSFWQIPTNIHTSHIIMYVNCIPARLQAY